jgi:hypothetical protein
MKVKYVRAKVFRIVHGKPCVRITKKGFFHKRSLPNDVSEKMRARGRAAVKYVRAKVFRIVHPPDGEPWVRITKDVPCTECERQYCWRCQHK